MALELLEDEKVKVPGSDCQRAILDSDSLVASQRIYNNEVNLHSRLSPHTASRPHLPKGNDYYSVNVDGHKRWHAKRINHSTQTPPHNKTSDQMTACMAWGHIIAQLQDLGL